MSAAPPIRALVAHASVGESTRLNALLRGDPSIAVIAEASSVDQTLTLTRRLRPDVVVMSIHLPAGGGLGATRRLMAEVPTPIVIVVDESDAAQVDMSVSALHAGALAIIPRPSPLWPREQDASAQRFVSTVKALSQVKVIRHRQRQMPSPAPPPPGCGRPARVVAIAASTGGPAALQRVLWALPASFPAPILLVQHIAPGFIGSLAASLGAGCALEVKVAVHGEPLLPQRVYVAPDGKHLGVCDRARILLLEAEPVGGFLPSATILFESVARVFGPSSLHVILTGMGRDGVAGLAVARALGGKVLAQDQASSVVFGMPGEAVHAGVVDEVVPLASMAAQLVAMTQGNDRTIG